MRWLLAVVVVCGRRGGGGGGVGFSHFPVTIWLTFICGAAHADSRVFDERGPSSRRALVPPEKALSGHAAPPPPPPFIYLLSNPMRLNPPPTKKRRKKRVKDAGILMEGSGGFIFSSVYPLGAFVCSTGFLIKKSQRLWGV